MPWGLGGCGEGDRRVCPSGPPEPLPSHLLPDPLGVVKPALPWALQAQGT